MPKRKHLNLFASLLLLLFVTDLNAKIKYKHRHHARGTATYYATKYEGRKTATGDVFSNSGYTAASNKFNLGVYARVTNLGNGKKVYVKINDRMGDVDRVIDLTHAAANRLGFLKQGTARVKVKVVRPGKGKRKIRRQLRH